MHVIKFYKEIAHQVHKTNYKYLFVNKTMYNFRLSTDIDGARDISGKSRVIEN